MSTSRPHLRAPNAARMVDVLMRRGMTLTSIAHSLQAPKSAVCRWHSGTRKPNFEYGCGLLFLISQQAPDVLSRETSKIVSMLPEHGQGLTSKPADEPE